MLLKDVICVLRPVVAEDIERSLLWRNNPEIKKNLQSYRLPITKPMEEAWIEKAMNGDKDRIVFSIDLLESNSHVGFVELNTINYFDRNAQFAIVIGDQNAHGKGIGFSATELILQYGFKDLNLHKVYLQVAAYNKPAISLYHKLGFLVEGTLKEQYFMGGEYHDMIAMGLTSPNFDR